MTHERTIGVAIVAAVVLLSGATAAFAATGTPIQDNETENETATVTFENQTSNGTAVTVNNTTLPEGGFVVIHGATFAENATADENETVTNLSEEYDPGPVLGNSSFLDTGDHENVTVELNESLEESQVLIAMAHQDTNGNETYEFPEADDPYVADGEPVTDDAVVTLENETNETMSVG